MTRREFRFNCAIAAMLLVALLSGALINKGAEHISDIYLEIAFFCFFAFLLFRLIAPLVFTYLDKFSTEKMQRNIRSHSLGKFFIINRDQK